MSTIDFDSLPLLNKFKFIPLSTTSKDVKTLLLGKWHHYCSKEVYNALGNILIFKENCIETSKLTYSDWSINDLIERKRKKHHPFMKKLEAKRINGSTSWSPDGSPPKNVLDAVVIFIDENIMLLGSQYRDTKIYLISDICIKEEASNLFETNDDILLYFSKIENYWENERIQLVIEIDESLHRPKLYFLIAILCIYIITYLILCSIYDSSIIVFLSGIIGFFFIPGPLFWLIEYIMEKNAINDYKKKHPNNRIAKIMTTKLLYIT